MAPSCKLELTRFSALAKNPRWSRFWQYLTITDWSRGVWWVSWRSLCVSGGYCHTRLHLGFSAKLRIWQASACKMEPRSGIIFCQKPAGRPADRPPDRVNILPEGKTPHVSNSTWWLLGVSMMSRRCLVGVLKVSMCVWRILGGCHEGISDVSGMYKG